MERLKGKTILIGKEPGQGRLLVAIVGGKAAAMGAPGSVPASVSRCMAAEQIAHAKVSVDQNGTMVVTNMKPQNVTYVNGAEIVSKKISPSDTVELGKAHFNINLPTVIETAKKIVGEAPPAPVDIKHLEGVWLQYHDSLRQLREKQKRINVIRAACGIFTMCAMPCISVFGYIGYALTGVGVIGNIYSFVGLKNDNTTDEQERLSEKFQESYVCPRCGKFLGNISYKLLKQQFKSPKDKKIHCPYCGCEFVEL